MENDSTEDNDIIERIRIKTYQFVKKKLILKIYEFFISRKKYNQLSRRLRYRNITVISFYM